MALPAVGGAVMPLVPGAVIDHFQSLGLEGRRQLVADSLGHTSHSGAPSILESKKLGSILNPMSRAFQYKPKFVDIRVRPPKEGEEEAEADVNALKPGERRCDHPGCRA